MSKAFLLPGFKCRITISQSLIAEYEWEARFHGDKLIKNEASAAKRTATSLANAAKAIRGMDRDDVEALEAAAAVMRRRAEELDKLAKWARVYHAHATSCRERDRLAEIDAFAKARWGDCTNGHVQEAALIQTLQTGDGARALGQFLHGIGRYSHVALEDFRFCFGGAPVIGAGELTERQHTAAVLMALQKDTDRVSEWGGRPCCWAGWESYELYREFLAATVSKCLGAAA